MAKFLTSHGKPILAVISLFALALLTTTFYLNQEISGSYRGISTKSRQDYRSPAMPRAAYDLASLIEDERAWLAGCQLPNGALAQAPCSNIAIPYFGNFAARTLIDINPEAARQYIS